MHEEMTATHSICKRQAHATYIKLSPRLHHIESRGLPEGICGRGIRDLIRDLNGVVQPPLVTEWPL